MDAIEKRARELLAAAYKEDGYAPMVYESNGLICGRLDRRERAAVEAIIAALTPPEGFVLVPVEPTYEMMTDACKTVIAMTEMKTSSGKLDPFTVSDCIWRAMIEARPMEL